MKKKEIIYRKKNYIKGFCKRGNLKLYIKRKKKLFNKKTFPLSLSHVISPRRFEYSKTASERHRIPILPRP